MRVRLLGAVALAVAAMLPSFRAQAATSPWALIAHEPTFMSGSPGAMFLLTNGRVLVQDQGANNGGGAQWWLYSPDAKGGYQDGTWSPTGSLPSGYAPEYFASGVMPDGRVVIEGGEFNGTGTFVATHDGAVYDPATGVWAPLAPPSGGSGCWSTIGDAPSVVLASGTFFMGSSGTDASTCAALLDASSLTWTTTGAGKGDPYPEEGFTLLPNGDVLDVNTGVTSGTPGGVRSTETYDPQTGTWSSAGDTPSALDSSGEVGPAALMPDGVVFAEGATSATALYDTATGTWSAGPTMPSVGGQQLTATDACSAVLPNGNVLFDASPDMQVGTHWFVYNGSAISQISDDAALSSSSERSNFCNALDLPNGQVLVNERAGATPMEVFTPSGAPDPSWAPTVSSTPSTVVVGRSYSIQGTQFGGLDEGASFGDDYNPQSNYPLVRVTNRVSGRVTYARTSGSTGLSVGPGTPGSTTFVLPASAPDGPSTLQVVVNGIASTPSAVSVTGGAAAPRPARIVTLTCVRGRALRRVRGRHPRCPTGWRLR